MRIARFVCVPLLCLLGCARPPEVDLARYQWFVESTCPGPVEFGGFERPNLLVEPSTANDPEVLGALECVLRYGLAGSPSDTLCFLAFGWNEEGEWLDAPRSLIDQLSDLGVLLAPVSEAGLNPLPPLGERGFIAIKQPPIPGARCTLELREWERGSRAVVHIDVAAHKGDSITGAGSTATLENVDGVWSIREWRGGRAWSPN